MKIICVNNDKTAIALHTSKRHVLKSANDIVVKSNTNVIGSEHRPHLHYPPPPVFLASNSRTALA